MVRQFVVAAALAAAYGGGARAQEATLARLLEEAASVSPEIAQARAEVAAARARVSQAGSLPDPSLTLGIQNDGFNGIQVGKSETSWYNIALTQPLYWPGKRGLREQVASLETRRGDARLARVMLDLEGRVRRAWIGLLLVRGQLDLLDEQERLWTQAERTVRSRYESGQVPQSDLLRAQLERARLQQRRFALGADAANRVAELNRLRLHPLDEAIPVSTRLAEISDPVLLAETDAEKDAETRSPELQLASAGIEQADRRVDLARKERFPDLAITAGVMPRGSMEPMWQLGISVGLPIFAGSKQNSAVEENEQRRIGESQGAEALRHLVRLRTRERTSALGALNRTNQHYRTQVLVLSAAAARSTLAQYEVGRVSFAAVLEALTGYISDRAGHLGSIADAQLVAIAHQEVSLEPLPSLGGLGSAGAMPAVAAAAARATAGTETGSAAAPTPSRGMGSGM